MKLNILKIYKQITKIKRTATQMKMYWEKKNIGRMKKQEEFKTRKIWGCYFYNHAKKKQRKETNKLQ